MTNSKLSKSKSIQSLGEIESERESHIIKTMRTSFNSKGGWKNQQLNPSAFAYNSNPTNQFGKQQNLYQTPLRKDRSQSVISSGVSDASFDLHGSPKSSLKSRGKITPMKKAFTTPKRKSRNNSVTNSPNINSQIRHTRTNTVSFTTSKDKKSSFWTKTVLKKFFKFAVLDVSAEHQAKLQEHARKP